MKQYRCVFKFANGRTTLRVEADDAERALEKARETVTEPAQVEVWDDSGLVIQRRDSSPFPPLPDSP